MKPNIDIDRISLEDRIKALELRLPVNTGPSGSFSEFLLDPKVVDSCKPNAFTDIGTGLVVRVDIDNFYDLQVSSTGGDPTSSPFPGKIFNNLDLKIAMFVPKINGIFATPTSAMSRFFLKGPISSVPGPLRDIYRYTMKAPLIIDSTAMENSLIPLMPNNSTLHVPLASTNVYLLNRAGSQGADQLFMEFDMYCYVAKPGSGHQSFMQFTIKGGQSIPGSHPTTYGFPSVVPSCSFGLVRGLPFSVYPTTSPSATSRYTVGTAASSTIYAGCFTGGLPSDLPNNFRYIYPQSWYA